MTSAIAPEQTVTSSVALSSRSATTTVWQGLRSTWEALRELHHKGEGAEKETALQRYQRVLTHSEKNIDPESGLLRYFREIFFVSSDDLKGLQANIIEDGKLERGIRKQFDQGKLKHQGKLVEAEHLEAHIEESIHRETLNQVRMSRLDKAAYVWTQLASLLSIPGDLFGVFFDRDNRGSHLAGFVNGLGGAGLSYALQNQGLSVQLGASFAMNTLLSPILARLCSGLDRPQAGGNIPPEVLQMMMQQQGGGLQSQQSSSPQYNTPPASSGVAAA